MSEPWFYCHPIPPEPGQTDDPASARVELDPAEAHHARGARRLAQGDRIVLFDGEGTTALAEIIELSRRRATVRIEQRTPHAPPEPRVHLASALPKGDRQATLLSMACQIGLASFTPLRCARSVATSSPGARERWRRVLVAACKQSRRPFLPTLKGEATPASVATERTAAGPLYLLDPTAEAFSSLEGEAPLDTTLVVGPEGGFTDEERMALESAGARAVSLGDGILRIETACVVGLSLFALGG